MYRVFRRHGREQQQRKKIKAEGENQTTVSISVPGGGSLSLRLWEAAYQAGARRDVEDELIRSAEANAERGRRGETPL